MRIVVLGAFLFAFGIAGLWWQGYVGSVLWGWFIVPPFGIKSLSVTEAIGLTLVAKFFSHVPTISKVKDKDEKPLIEQTVDGVSIAFGVPAISLLFGWIVHSWMC